MMARIDTSGLYDDDYAPDGDSALVYSLEEAAEIYAGTSGVHDARGLL